MKKKRSKQYLDQSVVCADCGTKENVKETFCPYSEEINNRKVEVSLCDKCYRERMWDI